MKILILSDVPEWALDNRAKAIQKYIPEYEFERKYIARDKFALADHEDFDLIHVNFTWGVTQYYDFIMKNSKKIILTMVNERSLFQGVAVDQKKLEKMVKELPYVTSVSPKISELYPRVTYIPNGINEEIFFKCKRPVVGYAGSLGDSKNWKAIEKACEELGLEFRCAYYYEGDKTYSLEQMQDFYMGLDIYVHASLSEGFNNTIVEALSCNLPVLMTRQGAWKEFQGWVEFIEPTVEGIKTGLQKFLGRRLIEDKFLWKNIVSQYKAVYERVYENLAH